jgi:glycosyltransferase involved in cell wall biosynthesis
MEKMILKDEPLVSVYIPTKNRADLLKRAVKSVINQTYKNLEIIIVNDGSDEENSQSIEQISNSDSRIILITNPTSLGACTSRNKAISMAKGKFVTGLDDDDLFHPQRIFTFLQKYDPKWSCLATNFFKITKGGAIVKSSRIERIIDKKDLFYSNCLGNQIFVDRERVLKVGGFDENLSASQDLDLWIRLIDAFGSAKKLSPCLYYMDLSHEHERISTSPVRVQGTDQFIEKYMDQMTKAQIEYKLFIWGKNKEVFSRKRQFRIWFGFGYDYFLLKLREKLQIN